MSGQPGHRFRCGQSKPGMIRRPLRMSDPAFVASTEERMLPLIQRLQRRIREDVVAAFEKRDAEELASVAGDDGGDTIYAVDRVSEEVLLDELGREADAL